MTTNRQCLICNKIVSTQFHPEIMNNYLDYLDELKKDKDCFHTVVNKVYNSSKQDELPNVYRKNSLKSVSGVNSIISRANSTASISGSFGSANSSMITLTTNFFRTDSEITSGLFPQKSPSLCFKGYDHATWYVSNAKQTASYFVHCLGFKWVVYKGLETGSKLIASHVVRNGNVTFEFVSPIVMKSSNIKEQKFIDGIFSFIKRHGDGVKDISFEVDDVDFVYDFAIRSGAKAIERPSTTSDEHGSIRTATIEVFGDIYHTLIERSSYRGAYLPGYVKHPADTFSNVLDSIAPIQLEKIDHCVQNEDWNHLELACDVYSKIFGFHKFWSADEKDVSTEFSALRSIVMASANEKIKMPINEPASGLCKSQIEEFLDYYNGPGVQHIAVLTNNIVETVDSMQTRGVEFIKVPDLYYEKLLPKLLSTGVKIEECMDKLKKLGILIDFDETGYLLQIFTKPLTDRPTFFLEIIQRHNHSGFGKGNFKALFQTIEADQRLRGTLLK